MATIKILKRTKPVPKLKRKPGTRAGLTKSLIAAAAVKLIDSAGMGTFSVRKLASAMEVGPTSIHAHFKGGTGAVLDAVAAQALVGTTRPFKPMEEPAEYLRELLLKMLEALHARPVITNLVVLRLSSDPILDPLLAERLLLTLAALGVLAEALPKMFHRAMGRHIRDDLDGVCAVQSRGSKKALGANEQGYSRSSADRVPNLTQLREALVAETFDAGASKPNSEVAAFYADRLIAILAPS